MLLKIVPRRGGRTRWLRLRSQLRSIVALLLLLIVRLGATEGWCVGFGSSRSVGGRRCVGHPYDARRVSEASKQWNAYLPHREDEDEDSRRSKY